MTAYLLDASVARWFGLSARKGWATCGLTQAGFVRIISNPASSSDALSPRQAMELLSSNLDHSGHRFWGDEGGFLSAAPLADRIAGHRQVTDAFLLGLAIHHKGKLATLDRAMISLVPPDRAPSLVEVIH